MTRRRPPRSVGVVAKLIAALTAIVCVAAAGAVAFAASTPRQLVRANQRAASNAANRLLGEVVLPAGSEQVPTEPAGDEHQLDRPVALFFFAAEVDRHEFWTTTAAPSEVIASVRAHLPPGTVQTGSGFSGTAADASFTMPGAGKPTIGPRMLAVDAVQLANGSTGVRADAAVRYTAPRLATQRIPASAGVLEVTMARGHSAPMLALTITSRATVRRIAAIVDRLPFVAPLRGVAISCPAIKVAPIVTFTFRTAAAGPILATVSEPANTPTSASPCFTAALTIHGRHQPGLLEGGVLLQRASAILGRRLVTRP